MHGKRLLISAAAIWIIGVPICLAGENWRFVMTCDSRGGGLTGVNEKILAEIVNECLQRDIDLVVFPGDLVYGAKVGPAKFEEQLWNWVRVMQPLYDADIPVYVCRGNHEVGDMWDAEPNQPPDPKDNYALRWLSVFGNHYFPRVKLPENGPEGEKYMSYSVVHKNALFVMLDQYAGMGHRLAHSLNQAWLDSQLDGNIKPHVFVLGHEPAFRALHFDCLDMYPDRRDAFWNSLRAAGGRAYFCGHDHFYDHARVDDGDANPRNDVHQFIVGTAGAYPYTWTPPYSGENSGFIVEQAHHAQRYGYMLVNVDDLEVTMYWMERRDLNPLAPPFYEARDIWRYRVSPSVVVLRPRVGEQVAGGQPYTIRWKTMDGIQTDWVLIEYSFDTGANWSVAGMAKNTGAYVWSAPMADSDSCLIRITAVSDSRIKDTTDGKFSIARCPAGPAADLNGDCRVDFADLTILLSEWLTGATPISSPSAK